LAARRLTSPAALQYTLEEGLQRGASLVLEALEETPPATQPMSF
jgi:hypothetical protein